MLKKILMVSDNTSWAFAGEIDAIEKYLKYKYNIDKAYHWDKSIVKDSKDYKYVYDIDFNAYDLIIIREILFFPLDILKNINPNKVAITISAHHCFDDNQFRKKFLELKKYFNYVICISKQLYQKSLEEIKDKKIFFAPMGVDRQFFYNYNSKKNYPFIVGWVGNASHLGDHKRFNKIFVEIIKYYKKNKGIKFKLAATKVNDALYNELMGYNNCEINEYNFYDMVNYYNSVDCLVNCSKSESICKTIVEAVCCGRPVVTTDVGYASNVLIHKANGFIVDNDLSEFISGIEHFKNIENYDNIFSLNDFVSETILDWNKVISFWDLVLINIFDSLRRNI